jgi:hypothetical protein
MTENMCQNCISFREGDDEKYGHCVKHDQEQHAGNACDSFVSVEGDWRCNKCRNRYRDTNKVFVSGWILWCDSHGRNNATKCQCKLDKEKFDKHEKTPEKKRWSKNNPYQSPPHKRNDNSSETAFVLNKTTEATAKTEEQQPIEFQEWKS